RDLHSGFASGKEQEKKPPGFADGNRRGVEIVFRPDPTIFDGRFANNGWLQELPKPLTKLTWDNAIFFSPLTAERIGLNYRVGTTAWLHAKRKPTAPLWEKARSCEDGREIASALTAIQRAI